MFKPTFALLAAVGMTLGAASTQATPMTLLETDFDSLSTGAVTAANLNGVTTGGSWALNTGRDSSTYTISDYTVAFSGSGDPALFAGDRALLADATGSQNDGVIEFATLTLDAAADFSANPVTVDFRTGTRRTGPNKALRYEFSNSATGTTVATLDWAEGGGLSLTGADTDAGDSAFQFLFAWIGANGNGARDLSFEFSAAGLEVVFNDLGLGATGGSSTATPNDPLENASLSVALGSTTIDTLTVYSINATGEPGGDAAFARGVFIDDITVTQIPEPSSLALLGLGGLMMIKRRRRN